MYKKILIGLLTIVSLAACQSTVEPVNPENEKGLVNVVTTVGMLGDMVENVGGDMIELSTLMGPGVDPHLYKASAGDISQMENADLIFYVGLHLEGKMVEIFESLSTSKSVYAIAEVLDEEYLLESEEDSYAYDPHIWFDVELWSQTVLVVSDALSELDPENADLYRFNAETYIGELLSLDSWVQEQINLIPEEQKIILTAHDAFNYFGNAYGMRVEGLQGISTASEFGLKDLEEMVDLIVDNKLKAIFVESSVPKKSIEALQEGVAAEDWNVEIGGELFSDAMGDLGTVEGTYVGMLEHNVNTIVNALK